LDPHQNISEYDTVTPLQSISDGEKANEGDHENPQMIGDNDDAADEFEGGMHEMLTKVEATSEDEMDTHE
jgi:hypothetical protein